MSHPRPQSGTALVADLGAALDAALDALDRAFAREEPFPVQGCLYCYRERDLVELSGPPRLVSDDLLSSVAAKVPGHWDDFPRLYRRLTPRVVRALVTGALHVDAELIASRLVAAGWSTWDERLGGALRDVWSASWRTALHTHPAAGHIGETLRFLAVTTDSLRPWLGVWTATRTPAADAHLADLVHDLTFEHDIAGLRFGFYDEYHAGRELLEWLLTDVRDRVERPHLVALDGHHETPWRVPGQ
ncbi:hypothetical protein AB0H29_07360 [Streptomyces thermolilacinus]